MLNLRNNNNFSRFICETEMWREQRTLTPLRRWHTWADRESCRARVGERAPPEELIGSLHVVSEHFTRIPSPPWSLCDMNIFITFSLEEEIGCFEKVRIILHLFISQWIFRAATLIHSCFLSRHHGCWSPGMKLVTFWHLLERWFWNLHLIYGCLELSNIS